jgi:PAS domain S-box-containing protein
MTDPASSCIRDPDRLNVLRQLGSLDASDDAFDRLARLAVRLLHAPASVVSLVDDRQQYLRGCFGVPDSLAAGRRLPFSHSFCRHTVEGGEPLIIEDAREHPLVRDNLSIREYDVAAYLGVPLRTADGFVVGSFCVVDTKPRRWTEDEVLMLRDLADSAITEIELRRELIGREQALMLLQEQRDFAVQVLSAMGQGLTVTNNDGRFEYVNPAFARMVGGEPEELIGRAPLEFAAPADPALGERARTRPREGQPTSYETRLTRADGSIWHAYVTDVPFRRGEEVAGVITVVSNISARLRVEKALQESETLLKLFIDRTPAAVAMFDPEMRYLLTSQRWLFDHRLDEQDVLGRCLYDVLPDMPDHWADAHRRALAGETIVCEEDRLVRQDGTVDWVSWQVFPWYTANDDVGGIIMATEFITQRKRAELGLRESEQRYRDLVENASDLIYQTDARGRFVYTNPMVVRLTGYTPEELRGTHFARLIRPDFRPAIAEFYRRQWAEEIPTTYFEFPILTRRGQELWIGQNVQLVRDGERFSGMQAVARDITGRYEIERMKDEFISVVSHELRTPLTAIHGSLRLLASGRLGELKPSAQRMLEIAAENTNRLIRLVNDILDIERIKSGRVELDIQPVEAAPLMNEAVELMQPLAQRSHVALVLEPFEASFEADPDRIIQTLYNLISNAIKFSEPGGTVRVCGSADADRVRFQVADQGRGIPEDKLGLIFERFEQVDGSDSRRKGGTGLGLAICKSIVEQHGGEIEVRSQLGKGSIFTVAVPRKAVLPPAERQKMTMRMLEPAIARVSRSAPR